MQFNRVSDYFADLVDRMAHQDEPGASSSQSVSWAAHREAEQLRDVGSVDELVRMAAGDKNKRRRAACYFIIGKIGGNLQDARCASVLLELLKTETDKYNIAAILDRVAEIDKPPTVDIAGVYALLDDSRWLVRHAAIRAINRSQSDMAEARVLQHLTSTEDAHDKIYCHVVLGNIGTLAAIAAIEKNLASRKPDVKDSAQVAIQAIRDRQASSASGV
jgi:HEAT repeat protein